MHARPNRQIRGTDRQLNVKRPATDEQEIKFVLEIWSSVLPIWLLGHLTYENSARTKPPQSPSSERCRPRDECTGVCKSYSCQRHRHLPDRADTTCCTGGAARLSRIPLVDVLPSMWNAPTQPRVSFFYQFELRFIQIKQFV